MYSMHAMQCNALLFFSFFFFFFFFGCLPTPAKHGWMGRLAFKEEKN